MADLTQADDYFVFISKSRQPLSYLRTISQRIGIGFLLLFLLLSPVVYSAPANPTPTTGKIILAERTAEQVLDHAIDLTGLPEAKSIDTKNGEVILMGKQGVTQGGTSQTKTTSKPTQRKPIEKGPIVSP
ncbi:MAG TPA: hypothetical protein VHZ76_04160 [Gammaproteobacteria bacterium]|jgi:hypothetical protein|nr:hypothetical protein [Gammaproteobacteria bacterium]